MPSDGRLTRFIVHLEPRVIDWKQVGKASSEAYCEKVSRSKVCTRCATYTESIYDQRWVKIKDAPIRNTSIKGSSTIDRVEPLIWKNGGFVGNAHNLLILQRYNNQIL